MVSLHLVLTPPTFFVSSLAGNELLEDNTIHPEPALPWSNSSLQLVVQRGKIRMQEDSKCQRIENARGLKMPED